MEIKVAELFAGVGGFRLGLEGWKGKSATSGYKEEFNSNYKVVWSNQWEPSTKIQEASYVYEQRFGSAGHSNKDIAQVTSEEIPNHDMLVGGFPCQDYSVARTLSQSGGLEGKKGVLWWEIHRILRDKLDAGNPVKYIFLENVDRLLNSPSKQRGRDFAIILASLSDLGYAVEWRIVNAADYGFPQRRRRIFILGYHSSTSIFNEVDAQPLKKHWVSEAGILAQSFPVMGDELAYNTFYLEGDLAQLSEEFNISGTKTPFENSGFMVERIVTTLKTKPNYNGKFSVLGDVLEDENDINHSFYLNGSTERWKYLKGSKNEKRVNKKLGFEYQYAEGSMVFPDALSSPSRTIITGEGGASPSRFKHVICSESDKLRRLTPVELERLNMFPDNHTVEASDVKRAFFMGNALVVGVIEKIGKTLMSYIEKHERTTV
jgi:DNA (cytosine-5)-methyltransferase 1